MISIIVLLIVAVLLWLLLWFLNRPVQTAGLAVQPTISPQGKPDAEKPEGSAADRKESSSEEGLAVRRWVAILTDPKNIQWLLALGAVLVVLGIIIWMASQRVFDAPWVQASILGLATISLLSSGWLLFLFTRYLVAARALVILGSALLPLNPWFLLEAGLAKNLQHLWLAGLMATLVYGIAAYAFRETVFVYVGVLSATLTMVWSLWEETGGGVTADTLAYTLMICSLLYLVTERAFPSEVSAPFSRQTFGLPFFWCSLTLNSLVLVLLYCLSIGVWAMEHLSIRLIQPAVGTSTVAVLSFLGAVAYLYSGLVVRRKRIYVYLAFLALLGGEISLFALIQPRVEVLILSLTGTALFSMLVSRYSSPLFVSPIALLSGLLCLTALLLSFCLTLSATTRWVLVSGYDLTWTLFCASLAVGAVARAGAAFYQDQAWIARKNLYLWCASIFLAGAILVRMVGLEAWTQQAPLLTLIAIGLLTAARLWRGQFPARPLLRSSQLGMAIILVGVLGNPGEFRVLETVSGQLENVLLSLVFASAGVYYFLWAACWKRGWGIYLTTLMGSAMIWQMLVYAGVPGPYYPFAFSTLGLGLLGWSQRVSVAPLARAIFESANAVLGISFIAAVLLAVARLGADSADLTAAIQPLLLLNLNVIATAVWVRKTEVYRFYFSMIFMIASLIFLTVAKALSFTAGQYLEAFSVGGGLILVGFGLRGFTQEREEKWASVTECLWLGSVMSLLPPFAAMLYWRSKGEISQVDEVVLFILAVAISTVGYFLKIKSSTLLGGAALIAHIVILLATLPFWDLVPVGVYMILVGAFVFTCGLILSFKREALLEIPQLYRDGEGLFKIKEWR